MLEAFNSTYDVRNIMDASSRLRVGKELHIQVLNMLRTLDAFQFGALMQEFGLLAEYRLSGNES